MTTPAPLLKVTVLFAGAGSKPKPLMVTVVALAARLAVLLVTTGATVATCTGVPLLLPLVVTTAVRLPSAVGLVPKVTVSDGGGGGGNRAGRAVIEGDQVVAGRRAESEAVDRDRIGIDAVGRRAAGHDRHDGGHLDRRAAADAVGVDDGRQAADGMSAWCRMSR